MSGFLAPFGRLTFWPTAGAVSGAFLFWLLGLVSGIDLLLWQVVLIAVVAVAITSIVTGLKPDTESGPELITRTVNAPTWRPFVEVNRWEDRFIFAETKPGRFETSTAKRNLVELVEERLRLRRGLSLRADPERCRELLGEGTFDFLTRPVADCPTDWQLDEHLRKIEEI